MDLNPFHYSKAEVTKALVALIGFGVFAVYFLIGQDFNPGLVPALQVLVPTGFAVYAVFAATNSSPADIQKALLGAISAGVGVWQYFGTVDENTVQTLGVLAGYVATFYAVYKAGNTPKTAVLK